MNIQKIAHAIVPASARDVGTGLYHIAKGDVSKTQCQKLVAGVIRISAAVPFFFLDSALAAAFPGVAGLIVSSAFFIAFAKLVDWEIAFLSIGLSFVVSGVTLIAKSINLYAINAIRAGNTAFISGGICLAFGWWSTRIPRDIKSERGCMVQDIDNFAYGWF